jgi:hypothetical protein
LGRRATGDQSSDYETKEELELPYDSAVVLVPTNYWEGWVEGQRDRDFALDISGLRLVAGIYLKF